MAPFLETGGYYWFRQRIEKKWRIGYVGLDPDDEQWLHPIGLKPMKVSRMDLGFFDWVKIEEPKESNNGRTLY